MMHFNNGFSGALVVICCPLAVACQSASGANIASYEAKTFHYQNARSLNSYLLVRVFKNGNGEIGYTDEISAGLVQEAGAASGETILVSQDPDFSFYLPSEFAPYTQGGWRYKDCSYSIIERGNFPFGGQDSPITNIEATCSGKPQARYIYSSQYGLLGIAFGDAPAGSDSEAHFFTSGQSYWLLGETPQGFSPQPKRN